MLSIISQLMVGVCTLSSSSLSYYEIQSHQMSCVKAVVQCIETETVFEDSTVDDYLRCT